MAELADGKPRVIVHPVHLLDAETLHHTLPDHLAPAAAALLGRLEDYDRGAGKVARVSEVARGPQEHRGVAVMAAGVHLAGHGRLVREIVHLRDRQRIHVSAQPDHMRPAALAAADRADDAGPADAGDDLVTTERLELFGNGSRCAMDVEQKLWVGVDVAPPGGDLVMQVGNAVHDRHLLAPRMIPVTHLPRAAMTARLASAVNTAVKR
jgi:hypothetical protein